MKYYDVYFRLDGNPTITVKANDENDALKIGQRILDDMTRDEILERYYSVIEVADVEVTNAIYIDNAED